MWFEIDLPLAMTVVLLRYRVHTLFFIHFTYKLLEALVRIMHNILMDVGTNTDSHHLLL